MSKRGFLSFELLQEQLSADGDEGATNARAHRALLLSMRGAIAGELTARQRECVQLYYYEGKTLAQAALCLGVAESTVCRHVKKARRRLSRVLGYGRL